MQSSLRRWSDLASVGVAAWLWSVGWIQVRYRLCLEIVVEFWVIYPLDCSWRAAVLSCMLLPGFCSTELSSLTIEIQPLAWWRVGCLCCLFPAPVSHGMAVSRVGSSLGVHCQICIITAQCNCYCSSVAICGNGRVGMVRCLVALLSYSYTHWYATNCKQTLPFK